MAKTSLLGEFRSFIQRGNVLELAVGLAVGSAFGTLVKSLVDDVIMPPIGLVLGAVDFSDLYVVLKQGAASAGPYASLKAASDAGAVTWRYGLFINSVVSFLIVAAAIFLVVRVAGRLLVKPASAPATVSTIKCPYCQTDIPLAATRCPNCTSDLGRG